MRLRLYDYPASGNCLKVRILLAHLGVDYERVAVDIFAGDTLTEEYASKNADRLTPLLEVGGAFLPESSAILWFLADGTTYLPETRLGRAQVVRWLLFEQSRVAAISALRFRIQTGISSGDDERALALRANGERSLSALETHLQARPFLADDAYSIADIANYAYVHLAPDAGLDLGSYPAVERWLRRIETQTGFINDLVPFPDNARVGRGLSIYG